MSDANCTICGKEFEPGEQLYVTGGATLEKPVDEPYADNSDEELYAIACVPCGEKISTAISYIIHPPERKVVIEVRGGVADVTSAPGGIEVQIIDHDNAEALNVKHGEGSE